MAKKGICKGCGAELRAGPAPCPLCGTDPNAQVSQSVVENIVVDVDEYQANVRELRQRLKKLREHARGA